MPPTVHESIFSLKKMKIEALKIYELIYLATPYSKYPEGIETAFVDACKLTGELVKRGLNVYSPIAHTHPIAIHAGIDPLDHAVWLAFDSSLMAKADALLVAMMPTWEISKGIEIETHTFMDAGKPVYYLDITSLEV